MGIVFHLSVIPKPKQSTDFVFGLLWNEENAKEGAVWNASF